MNINENELSNFYFLFNKLTINQCKNPNNIKKTKKFSREITRFRRKYWSLRSTLPGNLDFCAALPPAVPGVYQSKFLYV